MPSLYANWVAKWHDCRRCELHKTRCGTVLWRGPTGRKPWSIPFDLLFVGEAPGHSEDVLGQPFVGPAGKLLDTVIRRAVPPNVNYGLANLTACIPIDAEDGGKAGEPLDEHVQACAPRLQEFVRLADPKLIVTVGNLARDWLDWKRRGYIKLHREIPMVAITHPAAILRLNIAMRGLAIQKAVIIIASAIEEYLVGKKTQDQTPTNWPVVSEAYIPF